MLNKMKNLKNLEIIHIRSEGDKLMALVSYQDINKMNDMDDLNNGYDTIEIPINLRNIQYSSRGNMLVNQSVKDYSTVATNN